MYQLNIFVYIFCISLFILQIDSQKIEELRSKLKWVQGEAVHAKSKVHEIERQKKIDLDKLEMKILQLHQEYSNLKTELADVRFPFNFFLIIFNRDASNVSLSIKSVCVFATV